MDISHIPDDLKKREIFRYEQQAWHFLLIFLALWAGLLFAIVKVLEESRLTRNLVEHLFSFENLIPSLQGFLPWVIAFILLYSVWMLKGAMVNGFVNVKDASIDTVLTRKSMQAVRGVRWGLITSFLLAVTCLYVSLLEINRSERLLEAFSSISLPILMVILFIIVPIIENIIHFKEYTDVRGIFVKVEGVLSLFFCIGYFFPKAITFLFSINDIISLLMWGVFVVILFANLYFFIQKINLAIED